MVSHILTETIAQISAKNEFYSIPRPLLLFGESGLQQQKKTNSNLFESNLLSFARLFRNLNAVINQLRPDTCRNVTAPKILCSHWSTEVAGDRRSLTEIADRTLLRKVQSPRSFVRLRGHFSRRHFPTFLGSTGRAVADFPPSLAQASCSANPPREKPAEQLHTN